MGSDLLGLNQTEVLEELFTEATAPLYVLNPGDEVIEAVVEAGTSLEGDHPEVRVVAAEATQKRVFEDFLLASEAADLIAADALALRTSETLPQNAVIVGEDELVALVAVGDAFGGLETDEEQFVEDVRAEAADIWEEASDYSLRTPAISSVRNSMAESLGPNVREDFEGVMASLETARGDDDDLDEVTVSLLVAAKNDVLLYDVSKWGEDVGIASKATFSRTKTRLEDRGLIDTEKVPIEVGRPRLRLKLGDERLKSAQPADLASVAQSILAS